ncbi:hypothetical protein GIB67_009306 [Kingdonia uniflora]|uniref:Uncharacterized protein n=1 Tax=Kingdonia uniflora TaxID=39325 RepID=A0A7J7N2T3_9MAGN|nr:hypothetical protein GIB67_009306 [Kingdonia uniflora]
MVELCEDDPGEASKEMKRSMFQQTDAWEQSYNKVMKLAKGKLWQAIESLDLARGTEAKLTVKEGEKAEYNVNYQEKFDNECKVTVRLKEFIKEKRCNPNTLKPFPVSPELVTGDDLQMQEGDADVIGGVDGGTGGGVEAPVIEAIGVGTVNGVIVDGAGSKLSTRGFESVGVVGLVGEKDAALPI